MLSSSHEVNRLLCHTLIPWCTVLPQAHSNRAKWSQTETLSQSKPFLYWLPQAFCYSIKNWPTHTRKHTHTQINAHTEAQTQRIRTHTSYSHRHACTHRGAHTVGGNTHIQNTHRHTYLHPYTPTPYTWDTRLKTNINLPPSPEALASRTHHKVIRKTWIKKKWQLCPHSDKLYAHRLGSYLSITSTQPLLQVLNVHHTKCQPFRNPEFQT
jgi:hypothetical protein